MLKHFNKHWQYEKLIDDIAGFGPLAGNLCIWSITPDGYWHWHRLFT